MPFTQPQIDKILAENDSERVQLLCPKHNYVGSKLPPSTHGCKFCWQAYYTFDLASTPPHMRQSRLDELEHVIRSVVGMVETGKFDFVPDSRPEVKFTQDGFNDETGKYREDEK